MKGCVIFILIAALVGFLFLPEIMSVAATMALDKYKEKPWAEKTVLNAAKINTTFFRKRSGIDLYKRYIENFPKNSNRLGDAHYAIAFNYEQLKDYDEAIRVYETYLKNFSDHRYYYQGKSRYEKLIALGEKKNE